MRDAFSPSPSAPLLELYRHVGEELAACGVVCDACGRCCHFDEVDHVLYASAWERAVLLRLAGTPPPAAEGRCPYQAGAACRAREGRPLGCRVHFCRPPADREEALARLAEEAHRRLKALHVTHGVPWRYAPLLPLRPPPAEAPSSPSSGPA